MTSVFSSFFSPSASSSVSPISNVDTKDIVQDEKNATLLPSRTPQELYQELKKACKDVDEKNRPEKERKIQEANDYLEKEVLPLLIETTKAQNILFIIQKGDIHSKEMNSYEKGYETIEVPESVYARFFDTNFYKNLKDLFYAGHSSYFIRVEKYPTAEKYHTS